MRLRFLRTSLALCLLFSPLTSCGGSTVQAGASESESAFDGGAASLLQGLAQSLQQAPWVVPYSGIRRLDLPSKNPLLSYREEVAGDGQGGFQLNVLELLSSHSDPASVLRQLEQTKGFRYRYGGFRVQDAFLFQLSYQISLLSKSEVVAGIVCTRLYVERQDSDANRLAVDSDNHYLVDFDPNTGLVLRWQEIDALGDLVAMMEFESLVYGAPEMTMHPAAFAETDLSVQDDLSTQAGFKALRPVLLPQNFRLRRATLVQEGEQAWIRQVYTNGVETLLLMHRAKTDGTDPEASTIGAYVDGDRTVVMGTVNQVELIAEGRLSLEGMQDFVSSCFP